MKTRMDWFVWMGVSAVFCFVGVAVATPPWRKLIPFRQHVEADSNQDYWLTEDQGPWTILATTFAGPGAEQQAHELVLELRQQLDLPVYMHKHHFNYTESVEGLGIDRHGKRKRMRYANPVSFDEIAVLVGNYSHFDSPEAQKTLETIKTMKPACLDLKRTRENTTQRFIGLRELQRLVHKDPESKKLGPMRRAFISRNPLLPKEFFVPDQMDPLVLEMNENVEFSLLNNQGKYTVRVATFRGESYFEGEEKHSDKVKARLTLLGIPIGTAPSKLELAAENAHKLTQALRQRGIQAYEYHDRQQSIVTIGSYQSKGTLQSNGTILINPAILQIMKTYGPERQPLKGGAIAGLKPRTLDGLPFDVQPLPIDVPHRSLGSKYAARN